MHFLTGRVIGPINTSSQLQGITLHILAQGVLIVFRKIFGAFKNLQD